MTAAIVTGPRSADAVYLAGEATAALGHLRRLWPVLADARMPGSAPRPVQQALNDAVRDARYADWLADRKAAFRAAREGLKIPGRRPAPARLAAVQARQHITAAVTDLVAELSAGQVAWPRIAAVHATAGRPCRTCRGVGELPVQRPDDWPPGTPLPPNWCPVCHGRGVVYRGDCPTCRRPRPCGCSDDDAVMAAALPSLARLLPQTSNPHLLGEACRVLTRAVRVARAACGMGEDRRVIHAPCPACGNRDLYAEVSAENPAAWTVRCGQDGCRCTGPDCGCGRPVRWSGRRHLWPASEWDAPGGLADRLGVPRLAELRGE